MGTKKDSSSRATGRIRYTELGGARCAAESLGRRRARRRLPLAWIKATGQRRVAAVVPPRVERPSGVAGWQRAGEAAECCWRGEASPLGDNQEDRRGCAARPDGVAATPRPRRQVGPAGSRGFGSAPRPSSDRGAGEPRSTEPTRRTWEWAPLLPESRSDRAARAAAPVAAAGSVTCGAGGGSSRSLACGSNLPWESGAGE